MIFLGLDPDPGVLRGLNLDPGFLEAPFGSASGSDPSKNKTIIKTED